ncbi:isopenicillin N synthase family oxygenase [Pantoea sp. Acro-805]|uniref:2-oxoglutarate-dependent ethylene/succinate-forming enzyme n=1 Tax=Candidatus Pantoea formicae TaxID=2608355 RepID=A0ABX0QWR2_9GAMM|nr:isopenicillin N synthase family oxygenase [Pantoea formicae]NIF01164.1 isopenicillin N synthase family oxygenase [Pantoea formicae]
MAGTLPVLDLALLELPDAEQSPYLAELRTTARDVGFFYLINHGINSQLLQNVQSITQAFFALPDEKKQQVSMIHSPHFRGYNRAGVEYTREQRDQREQFDIGAERAALALQVGDPAWKRLQGPNLWPDALPQLRPVIHAWQQAMTGVALRLLRAFARSLSLPSDAFDALYGTHPNEHVKLIRYPGQAANASQQGVGAHKDSGFLTFLLQDDQPGLQVEVTPDNWVDALPMPGAFVVNIGELLEIATNGYLRATVHRVVSPSAQQERVSIAFFLGAQLDAEVPIYQLPPQLAADARGPTSDPTNPLLREVGWNYLKGRLRSHRDVAARYYADALITVKS